MANPQRPLLLHANRLLGAALVEHNLVKIEDLEKADERLLQIVASSPPRQCTVLGILADELKVVREEDDVQYLVENGGISAVDLRFYEVPEEIPPTLNLATCWATWSLPFDKVDGFNFVASAYYLSPVVRSHWENLLNGPILWFGTAFEGIADYLEKLEAIAAKAVKTT